MLFTEDDRRYLRMAGEVLADQVEALLDVWYGFVGSHPHLVRYFSPGHTLLKAVYAASRDPDLSFLAQLHQAGVLRVVFVQNYLIVTGERGREVIKRREAEVDGLPPGRSRITSPYDTGARWGVKRDTFWNGYKVHVTLRHRRPRRRHRQRKSRRRR